MLDILRQTPETKDIKVIMMTALSSDDQRKRGEGLGADKYLIKSQVGIEDVIAAVHEVLGEKATKRVEASATAAETTSVATPEAPAAGPIAVAEQPAAEPVAVAEQPITMTEQPAIIEQPVATEQPVAMEQPMAQPVTQPMQPQPVQPVQQGVPYAEPTIQPAVQPVAQPVQPQPAQPIQPIQPVQPVTPAQ